MEIVKAVWQFLLDSQNREVLGWSIGGIVAGIALIIGGRTFFRRKTKVSAKNRSVAAGRDINISGETRPPLRRSRKHKR